MSAPLINPKTEAAVVLQWQKIRQTGPKYGVLIKPYLKGWSVLAVMMLIYAAAMAILPVPAMCFAIGICAGAILRDFGFLRKTILVWPFVEKYLDWERIEEAEKRFKS